MSATMTKKKPRPESPAPDRHKAAVISFRPPPAMRAVLESLAAKERRSLSQTIELLVEAELQRRGLYEPEGGGD
jgi:hypothetical protein